MTPSRPVPRRILGLSMIAPRRDPRWPAAALVLAALLAAGAWWGGAPARAVNTPATAPATAPAAAVPPAADPDSDESYRDLYRQYHALILPAAQAGNPAEVARLTEQLQQTVGGRLLFVEVTRTVPGQPQLLLTRKVFDVQGLSRSRVNYGRAVGPQVTRETDGPRRHALVETGAKTAGRYPDDLYITMTVAPPAPGTQPAATRPALLPGSDDYYRDLYHRFRAAILPGARAGDKVQVALLTDQLNASIGGRLLSIAVSHRNPGEPPLVLISKQFRPETEGMKINFATADDPHVTRHTAAGQPYVRIEAGGAKGQRGYADGLYIIMTLEPVPPTGAFATTAPR